MKLSYYYKDPDAVRGALKNAGIERHGDARDDLPDGWHTKWDSQPFGEDLYITFDTETKELVIDEVGTFVPKG